MQFILTADWHLRQDKPICRLDEDWIQKQKDDVERVVKLAKEKGCPIVIVGDIYDTPRVTPEIEQILPRILNQYNVEAYVLAGNHDLRFNSLEYLDRCSIGTLLCSKHIHQLEDTPEFVFRHVLVFKDEKDMPPNVKARTASELLDEHKEAQIVFTGDMHHQFIYREGLRYVINPGCLNIQVGNMRDYECGVWCIDTDTKVFNWIPLPDNPEMVTNEHNVLRREKMDAIGAFIEYMKTNDTQSFDFWEVLKQKQIIVNDSEVDELIMTIKEIVKDVK